MPNAIIYVRVSSDEQVKGMSLGFQKQDCLAYAKKKGLIIERIFEEKGESAKFADRPELIDLLEYSRRHRRLIDALIVWKIDRLSRNQLDYYYLKRTLRDLGITIHSATEPSMDDSSSIAGKIFETFSALQAEIDNTVRSERARRGMAAKIASGIHPWRSPIGYVCQQAKRHGEKKTRPDQPHPELFSIIQSALREYARGRRNQRELAAMLDERGLAQIRGCKTHHQFVHRLLYDYLDFYHGEIVDPWSGERYRGQHVPMFTDEEYLRIVAARDGRSYGLSITKKPFNPDFPLRRTIRCAGCGRFLTGSYTHKRNGKRFGYYHCQNRTCSSYGRCLRKRDVETRFEELVERYTMAPDFLDWLRVALEQALDDFNRAAATKIAFCTAQIDQLEAKRRRTYEMREDGSYTKEEFLERKGDLERQINQLKIEQAADQTQAVDLDRLFKYANDFVQTFGGKWSTIPDSVKTRFQNLLLPEGIHYDPASGYQTAKMGPVFELNQRFRLTNSPLVDFALLISNQLMDNLRSLGDMMADIKESESFWRSELL